MVYICYFVKNFFKLNHINQLLEAWIEKYYCMFPREKSGIAKCKHQRKFIVSLTTIPSRIDKVWLTIESLLRQIYKPDEIVLWLAEDEFKNIKLPAKLQQQQKRGLTIRYCDNLKSYKKFYYTALENPDAFIVTVDDDIIYAETMLRDLAKTYKQYPKNIICSRSHLMKTRRDRLLPYRSWLMYEKRKNIEKRPSYYNFFTSGAGTLFPMFLMNKKILDKEVFLELAPNADDIWLNFIAWISEIKTQNVKNRLGEPLFIESSASKGLYYQNLHQEQNDVQIKNVMEYLNIDIRKFLKGDK